MHILGQNLQCVIHMRETDNWKAFATWFSINKFLPKAKVSIVLDSIEEQPFEYLQWAKRLNLTHKIRHKIRIDPTHNRLDAILGLKLDEHMPLLVVTPYVLITNSFDEIATKSLLIDKEGIYIEKFNKENLEKITDDYLLLDKGIHESKFIHEATDTMEHNLITIRSGCGKWRDGTTCPFSNSAKLRTTEMTVNEINVLSLWSEMIIPYDVYN